LLLTDLANAFALLTRLPIPRSATCHKPPDLARCIWAFPLVGLIVNGTGALGYWLARTSGMPPLVAAAWTLALTLMMTGALHEDGLADTADGFGGGATAARKLEIMRDSRIGTYGTVAVLLSLIVRTAAIANLDRPTIVLFAMILVGMLGRGAMIPPLLVLSPARTDGMGASFARPRVTSAAIGFAAGLTASYVLLPPLPATALAVVGIGSPLVMARLASCQIRGQTGDVLGATEVVTESAALTVIACSFGG
jgi:adenosylcobinamide-GDP ribazoletransferase